MAEDMPQRQRLFIPRFQKKTGDEDMIGKLELSLYGTRDAALNWAIQYSSFMKELGLQEGTA